MHDESENVARLAIDREMCQGAATCLAWQFYELDDEVKAILLTTNGSNSDEPKNPERDAEGYVLVEKLRNPDGLSRTEMQAQVLESAKACPFNAILVRDAEGKQIWPL